MMSEKACQLLLETLYGDMSIRITLRFSVVGRNSGMANYFGHYYKEIPTENIQGIGLHSKYYKKIWDAYGYVNIINKKHRKCQSTFMVIFKRIYWDGKF